MTAYFAKKIAMILPTLLIISVAVFVLIRMIPGDPVLLMMGDSQDQNLINSARHALGADRSVFVQYLLWLKAVLTLNLGRSIVTGEPVSVLILERFTVTAQLVALAMAASLVIAIPAGLCAAWQRGRKLDRILVFTSVLLMSVPSFWVAFLLMLVFGVSLRWFPTIGFGGPIYLVLPAAALAATQTGTLLRMMRASASDVMGMDYVTHAYAKGLGDAAVLLHHVLRNAFTPVLSLTGWLLGTLLAGTAVIETVFTLPGMGRLLVDSIYARDYPVVQAIALFVACLYIAFNLAVDFLYPFFDPPGPPVTGVATGGKHKLAIGALCLAAALAVAALSPMGDPLAIDLSQRLSPPSLQHWFGTDQYGRDLFIRTLAAAPLSFFVSILATVIALAIGSILGGLAGYRGGAIDQILSAVADSLAALPALLLALLIMAIVGPSSFGIAIAVGIASAPSVTRVVRGAVLSIRRKDFVEAGGMLGGSHAGIFLRHILPNCITPLTVLATTLAPQALLIESALSFLGLGAPPPTATWGGLLADSRQFIASAPWLGIFPGLALSVTILAFNLMGDSLRERFDKGLRS